MILSFVNPQPHTYLKPALEENSMLGMFFSFKIMYFWLNLHLFQLQLLGVQRSQMQCADFAGGLWSRLSGAGLCTAIAVIRLTLYFLAWMKVGLWDHLSLTATHTYCAP